MKLKNLILHPIRSWKAMLEDRKYTRILKSSIWSKDGKIDKKLFAELIKTPVGHQVILKMMETYIRAKMQYAENIICEVKEFGWDFETNPIKNMLAVWADTKSGDVNKTELEKLVKSIETDINIAYKEIANISNDLYKIDLKYASEA